jgi:D-sedoheptulose 7-phosphate isomerase
VSDTHFGTFLAEAASICGQLDAAQLERLARQLRALRERGGRLFVLGVGGSAANASHAVNDFRKLCGIEAYAPTDNVAELTARTNDEGWQTVFAAWLRTSRAGAADAVLVLSVGGGSAERNVSANLVYALDEAKRVGMRIFGIVGRDGGYTKKVGDEVIVIPTVAAARITPHTEAFQAVVWHGLVSHPELMVQETKWEGMTRSKKTAPA